MYQLGGTSQIGIQVKIHLHAPLCRLVKQLQDFHRSPAPVFPPDTLHMAYMQGNLQLFRHGNHLLQRQQDSISFISDMGGNGNVRPLQGLQCFHKPISVIFKFRGIGNSKADSKRSCRQSFLHSLPNLV